MIPCKLKVYHRIFAFICALFFLGILPSVFPAAAEPETIRVGYYENEVFQEGARDGAVKTGYAYEYYRKLSEYTGWKYEYVYGGFGELYQMLLDGNIDLLAGLAWREERASLIAQLKNMSESEVADAENASESNEANAKEASENE